ncbi:MAG: VWA domain-containing protein, partial [Candidatus Helarchaeota archaeon]
MSEKLKIIKDNWLKIWPEALRIWSKYIKLREPIFILNNKEVVKYGLTNIPATVSMADLGVNVNLIVVEKLKLEDFALMILAHEVGHHVLCPNNLVNMARMINLMKPVFGNIEQTRIMENLYGDLLINDRLFMSRKLPMHKIYIKMM